MKLSNRVFREKIKEKAKETLAIMAELFGGKAEDLKEDAVEKYGAVPVRFVLALLDLQDEELHKIPTDEEVENILASKGLDVEKLAKAFILGFKSGMNQQRKTILDEKEEQT